MMAKTLLGDLNPLERFDVLATAAAFELPPGCDLIRCCSPLSTIAINSGDSVLDDSSVQDCAKVLLGMVAALQSVELVSQEVLRCATHIYLLGDGTVAQILQQSGSGLIVSAADAGRYLEALSVLGLVYRFNVARKFGYPPSGLMQIRLNGWGGLLAQSKGLGEGQPFRLCSKYCDPVFTEWRDAYLELIALCTSSRPLQISEIHRLNSLVPMRVVT
jgi:hypothetical protein